METSDTPSVASIDLARHYGVSERTLYSWRKKGLIILANPTGKLLSQMTDQELEARLIALTHADAQSKAPAS